MPEGGSLTTRAYWRIRDMVVSGQINPDEKIQIDRLKNELKIGASPIREALSLLSAEHMIERADQRGFRAAGVSADDFSELLNTRCWIEEMALRDAIRNGGADWQEQIVLSEYRLSITPRDAGEDNGTRDWETVHREFHMVLLSACKSKYLLHFCSQLYDMNVRYRNIAKLAAYPMRKVEQEHKEIAQATLERDEERAVTALTNHYRHTGEFLSKKLREM